MGIFGTFRRLVAALEKIIERLVVLAEILEGLLEIQRELGPARGRLEALELSRATFEAEMGALVLKADGKLKAASNAEARERQLKKSYERLADEIDIDGPGSEPEGNTVLGDDAEASEAERLHAMHLGVAPVDGKTARLRAKFGV